ncbi:MAG: ankyrin repeat domain-containing protein [Rhodanobacter sp.]
MIDKHKVDGAFRDAIRGGRLASVQKIWSLAGGDDRPSLWFEDDAGKNGRRRVPVSLLLSRPYRDMHWEGLQTAQWLASRGCDLKARAANGDTLLHKAVHAGDLAFVRYLLAEALDVSALGEYGLPALSSAQDEGIALLLLQAGSDWQSDDGGARFKRYAQIQHWGRVLAWLAQHPK